MIVADTSALVAILRREPEFRVFQRILSEEDGCLVSAVSLLEISIVLAGRDQAVRAWARLDELLAAARAEIVAHDAGMTLIARDAFLRYGKGRHPAALNFGDCATYALAKQRGLRLLFKGEDFARTDIASAL